MTATARIASRLWEGFAAAPFPTRLQQTLRSCIMPYEQVLSWLPQGASMLDIGCGAGAFLYLSGQNRDYAEMVGVDGERVTAQARAVNAGARHAFLATSDFHDWPDRTFDCVSLIDVMHHVAPAAQDDFLAAALARVGPGGRLIYKDMADAPAFAAWFNRAHDLLSAREWIKYYPLGKVRAALDAAGFAVRNQSAIWRGPYLHELLIADRPA